MLVELLLMVLGIGLLAYCSDKAVDHAIRLAAAFGIPTIIIGVLVVSVGTDLPEIVNSIVSSGMGHGDINVGDSIGSCLAQISLILGLVGVLSEGFQVNREDILELGRSTLMGLLLAILVFRTGYISRLDAAILIVGYLLLVVAMRHYLLRSNQTDVPRKEGSVPHHLIALFTFLAGVGIGSYLLVTSAISISRALLIPEYIISFFAVAIGTSLPELVVDLAAVRKKEYSLAMGDVIGSCIVDSTLSIGIGALLFPVAISGGMAFLSGIWTFLVSLVVFATLWSARRVNRKISLFLILLYLASYAMLFGF